MQRWATLLILTLLCGCGGGHRMEHPEDPQGRFHDEIAAAKQVLEQKEDWAERAEWEVLKEGDRWRVIAWRVEHADKKGAERYLPWGYSVIELDSRLMAVDYQHKG